MFHLIDAAILAMTVSVAAAETDRVPNFNVEPHCRAVASLAAPIGDAEACIRQEQQARVQLIKQWDEFGRAEKDYCLPLSTLAGEPTYSELLSCLEVERDARRLRFPLF
jgi:hypothetical protein